MTICCLSPQEMRLHTKGVAEKHCERSHRILGTFTHKIPVIDVERARYFTESMKQTEGQLLALRWAKALKNCAEKMTVYITPNQLIAGRAGQLGRYGILYPEVDGDFYTIVIKDLPNRTKSPFKISDDDSKIALEEIAPYWEGKTYHEHLNKALPEDLRGVTYTDKDGLQSRMVVSETSSYLSLIHISEPTRRTPISY